MNVFPNTSCSLGSFIFGLVVFVIWTAVGGRVDISLAHAGAKYVVMDRIMHVSGGAR